MGERVSIGVQLTCICAITLFAAGLFARIGADPHHDALLLKPAIDVARGKTLFVESFTQYGALTTLIQAASIKAFGERLLTIRMVTVLFVGAYAALFWWVWSQILKPAMATLAWLSCLGVAYFYTRSFLPWSSEYALFFEALGVALFFRYLRKGEPAALFLAGVAGGLAFWCKQNTGPLMAIGMAVALLLVARNRRTDAVRPILALAAGFAASFVPFLIWLAWSGALRAWFQQSIQFALYFARSGGIVGSTLHEFAILALPASLPWSILPLFCLGVALHALWKLLRRERLSLVEEMAVGLSIVSLALISQYYPMPDQHHFYWAGVPAFGVLFYGLAHISRKRLTFVVIYAAIFAGAFDASWQKGSRSLAESTYSSDSLGVLSGMRLNQGDYTRCTAVKQTIDRYVQAYPDMGLLNATPDALWMLFAPDVPFHPSYVYWRALAATIYPDYLPKLEQQIALRRHMLLSWNPAPAGYTKVRTIEHIYPLYLYVPTDKLLWQPSAEEIRTANPGFLPAL